MNKEFYNVSSGLNRKPLDDMKRRLSGHTSIMWISVVLLWGAAMCNSCVSQGRLNVALERTAQLEQQLTTAQQESAALRYDIKLMADSNPAAREIQRLRSDLKQTQLELSNATQQRDKLGEELTQTNAQVTKMSKIMREAEEKVDDLTKQVTQLKLRIKALSPSPNAFAVIAPSVSTSMEARRILAQQRWTETSLRYASHLLVVVRSMLFNPLIGYYEHVGKLIEDAENQLNIAGESYHVYIFSLNEDLCPTEVKHVSYKAKD